MGERELTDDEKATIEAMYRAVQKYVEMRGGTVIVASGPDVMQWASDRKLNYTIAVRCTGVPPQAISGE
jgi:hypothetical protein